MKMFGKDSKLTPLALIIMNDDVDGFSEEVKNGAKPDAVNNCGNNAIHGCPLALIDSIIAKAQSSIEKLKEYQTSLISAAVTGKINFRGESHD